MQPVARRFALALALALAGLACRPVAVHAEAAPIFLDGFFPDWSGPVEHVDPAGDGAAGGIDIRDLDLANDADWLFVRFEVGVEIGLQATNNLYLYLDTDQNAATGTPISGIGAELRWNFGTRQGTFYRPGGSVSVFQDDLRLRQLPSITSTEFEVAMGRDVRPDGTNLLFPGAGMRVLLRHEVGGGDQAPNAATTLAYLFDATPVPPPAPVALPRTAVGDVRITTWNVLDLEANGGGWNPGATPSADRVFSALDPDVVCFQEIYDNTAAATAALLEGFLPSGAGEAWYARENTDVKVVSRFPVLGQWNLDGGSGDHNLAVLLDATAALGRHILLVGAHMFCCSNDAGRQQEVDRIAAFLRDAKAPGGAVTVTPGTLFVITGDLNLVGQSQQLGTLMTGDIVDEGTFGPDFAPDWDGTALADVVSSQTHRRFAYTWRNDFGSFAPGRLDYFIYSDSVAALANHFILYTPEMSPADLALYGLQANDVTTVSDHLPHTADFRPPAPTDAGPAVGGGLPAPHAWALVRAEVPRRGSAGVRLSLERSADVEAVIYDVRGTRVATLRAEGEPVLAAGTHRLVWDGVPASGDRAPAGTYIVRVLARDGSGMLLATSTKLTLLR
jgi:exonuclease III